LNKYYFPRLKATVRLYNAKKVSFVVVSRNKNNVVKLIKKDLIKLGIPEKKIYLDFKGITSYDAMYRIHKVYGQKKFIVISQNYQLERAIYLAKHYGLQAVAYAAKCERDNNGIKINFIEKYERVKMFYYIFTKKKPIYFGEKVQIF
jgi:SanA protein